MKQVDWARFSKMDSKDKADIHTTATFAEKRREEDREKEKDRTDFGLKKMEEEVDIDWGKDE